MAAGAVAVFGVQLTPAAAQVAPPTGAVIVQYHRFGENDVPTTNIRLEQFDAHIAELKRGGFNVVPLTEIVDAMRTGRTLPDRTIAITVDDAYVSAYTEAWPRLKATGFPLTLFVSTDIVDQRSNRYMTWAQIRDMAREGVTIGGHGAAHAHMPDLTREQIVRDIERSNIRYQQELGQVPTLFAYPFGEMSLAARDAVKAAGYLAAFGQHSGVAEAGLDLFFQPRFSFNEQFGAQARFVLAINALPLGARDITPDDPVLLRSTNPPAFGFTVADGVRNLDQINCFASHEATPARLERLGGRRIEVRPSTPFPAGRGRFNCTVRADSERWRWFGTQFYVPAPGAVPVAVPGAIPGAVPGAAPPL